MPSEIIPYLFYQDLPAALDWLTRVFGLTEITRTGTPGGGMHAEMRFGDRRIMMGHGAHAGRLATPREAGAATMGVFVYLDDVDAHYAHAASQGADIRHPPHDVPYGRTYEARDLEGHPWYFTTAPSA